MVATVAMAVAHAAATREEQRVTAEVATAVGPRAPVVMVAASPAMVAASPEMVAAPMAETSAMAAEAVT